MALATCAQSLREREERFLTVHPQATASAQAVFAEHLKTATAPA